MQSESKKIRNALFNRKNPNTLPESEKIQILYSRSVCLQVTAEIEIKIKCLP